MASSDVDQKYLGRIAQFIETRNPLVSDALFQILGLSVVLSRKLYRARKLRRLDTTRDTRSLQLYHHIIWLCKEGLKILQQYVLPYTQDGQEGPECQVLTSKLLASFVHILCLFHNDPPVTVASGHAPVPVYSTTQYEMDTANQDYYSGSGYESMTPQKETTPPKRNSRGKQPSLRDPINSMTSEASFLTNPYAGVPPGVSPPPTHTPAYPPGLGHSPAVPHPSEFLLPSRNFIPIAIAYFNATTNSAAALLPGAHPLRLSTAIEYAAFLWDCVHDHDGARTLARRTIRSLKDADDEGASDEALNDGAEMVQILARIMRRKSFETTPRTGQGESTQTSTEPSSVTQFPPVQPVQQTYLPTPPQDEPSPRRQPPQRPPRPPEPLTPPRQAASRTRSNSYSAVPIAQAPQPATPLPTPPRPTRESSHRRSHSTAAETTSPRRRDSASSKSHRRSGSQASPSQTRTPQRTMSSRRRESRPEPVTPPKPPPKDPGYTPSRSNKSRRSSGSQRRVEFAPEGPRTAVNSQGPQRVNGYYGISANDQRGKGER